MTKHATVIRYNKGLKQADEKIVELLDRYKNVNLSDRSQWANTSFAFARQLKNMLELARVIVQGARSARRIARRALQARLPRARRRAVPEDHQGQLHRIGEARASSTKRWTRNSSSRARAVTTRRVKQRETDNGKQDCIIRNQAPGQPRCSRRLGELRD